MTTEVKGLTDVVKDVAEVKNKAGRVAKRLRQNIDDVTTALDLVEKMSDALGDAGAELRGVLGTQTNNPPKDEQR